MVGCRTILLIEGALMHHDGWLAGALIQRNEVILHDVPESLGIPLNS